MSDEQILPEENPESKTPAAGPGVLRLTVLGVLLAALVGALLWDRQVARPRSKAMMDQLDAASSERARSPKRQLSQTEVQQVLGRPPADSQDGRHYVIERFCWQAGLPWRSYDINVVYQKTSKGPVYLTAYYAEEPDPQMLPGYEMGTGGSQPPKPEDFMITIPGKGIRPWGDKTPEGDSDKPEDER